MNRPLGVSIWSALQGLGSAFSLILGVLLCVGADAVIELILSTPELQEALRQADIGDGETAKTVLLILGIIIIVFSLLGLFYAVSLWQLKRWSWYFTIGIQSLSVGLNVLAALTTGPTPDLIFSIMIAAVILVYFFRRKVKYAFGIGGRKGGATQAVEDDTDF
jgi:uncharacterized membrane protein (DUF2068 family)